MRRWYMKLLNSRSAGIVLAVGTLGAAQWALFSRSWKYCFQGDSLFLLYYRFKDFSEFLHSFAALDFQNFFRPLGSRLLASLFYPLAGLRPGPYHVAVFLLLFVVTCAVFLLLRELSGGGPAAFAGAFFFAVHTVNAFTSFGLVFEPELSYGLFYVLSFWFLLRAEKSGRWRWRGLSYLAFLVALLCKEAAVTLPAVMLCWAVLFPDADPRFEGSGLGSRRMPGAGRLLKRLGGYFLILFAYLLYVFFYLRSGDFLLRAASDPGYHLNFGSNVLDNLMKALAWSLNLPVWGAVDWKQVGGPLSVFLVFFALFQGVMVVMFLWGRASAGLETRRRVLIGLGWFFLSLAPMLAFGRHFLQYYLFVPLVGISFIVGLSFAWIWKKWKDRSGAAILVTSVMLLGLFVCNRVAGEIIVRRHPFLGPAGEITCRSISSALKARPRLEAGTVLYILDDPTAGIWWNQGGGNLFRLLYGQRHLDVRYRSMGDSLLVAERAGRRLVVFRYSQGALVDVTAPFKANPASFLELPGSFQYVDRGPGFLTVHPSDVRAGKGSYTIRVSTLAGRTVQIQFRLNDGPVSIFRTHLDDRGEARYFVSSRTRLGLYRFIAVKGPGQTAWQRCEAGLRVR